MTTTPDMTPKEKHDNKKSNFRRRRCCNGKTWMIITPLHQGPSIEKANGQNTEIQANQKENQIESTGCYIRWNGYRKKKIRHRGGEF